MNKLIHWLENSFAPKMNKVNTNVWIVGIKDGIMQTLPFIFLGSVFCMLTILNDYIPNLPNFWVPFGWTMGMVSLFVAFLVPFNIMEKKRLRKNRINAGLAGLVLFLIIITPQVVASGNPGFGHESLGAGGMFIAMVAGLISAVVFTIFSKFSFFKEESVIPDFVRSWFDSMLPIGIIILFGWIVVDLVGFDLYNMVLAIFKPLAGLVESPIGFPLTMFIFCFLYSLGISSWVLTPILTPVFLDAMQANISGLATNLVTNSTVYSSYLWVGGIGCTFPLVIMCAMSRSKKLSALGKACIGPSVFNINEPIVFGAIAWNPILMIPMWLQGIILPIIVWVFTKVIAFAPIPNVVFEMWYCPFPISTWLITRSIPALILLAGVVLVATLIWLPFFRVYERQQIALENSELKEV
ncbi:PTS sugar transporter subunit IIC [Erysipelothrix sp. HDW6C]|uniref:PTS sugar transporter subunit IIC n=1 Tax=Erysipelothrix sp. HDW6C TaxID=2714930 RepID=UPI00140CACC5|nr:PTS transporter subunit EIIC [Erysipelothrix sp. HDW6C]QIK69070.1 PTS sugar transporter subunit IIC [Erysipelothrix sp. HDW6C]